MSAKHSRNVFMLLVLFFGFTLSQAAPLLKIDEPVFDFGNAPGHAKVSHSFWLKSAGDDTLKILSVVPGCGCTKAPLEKDKLAPGDSTRLQVTFSTGSYRGHVAKSPRISTNEGGTYKTVRILTNVLTRPDSTYPLVVTPHKIDISQFGKKERKEVTFTITNVTPADLTVNLVDVPSDVFTVELPKKVDAGKSAEGKVRLAGDGDIGDFERSVTFEVNDEQHTRFTIPVHREVRSTASASK